MNLTRIEILTEAIKDAHKNNEPQGLLVRELIKECRKGETR